MCSLLGLQLLFRYSEKMHAEKVQAKTLRICIITNDLLSCILAVTIFFIVCHNRIRQITANLHILWLSSFRILPGSTTSPLTTPVLNLRHVFLFLTSLCVFGHITPIDLKIFYTYLQLKGVTTEESQMDEKPEDGA